MDSSHEADASHADATKSADLYDGVPAIIDERSELASPRTSFCLLEAAGEDRDSATSSLHPAHSPQTTTPREPHSYHHRFTPTSSRSTSHDAPPVPSLHKTSNRAVPSNSTVPVAPLLEGADADNASVADSADFEAMNRLFRLDSSVYANPDNITPSLQTSIIMGESQIVGQNGALASLYPGKRRQRRATDAIARQDSTTTPLPTIRDQFPSVHHHTGDTFTTSMGADDSPMDLSVANRGSDDLSACSHSLDYDNHTKTWWRRICCCSCGAATQPTYKESMTLPEFMHSLWARAHADWDSYLLFFTLALAVISIPVAVGIAALLNASNEVAFKVRCQFRIPKDELVQAGVSTALIASVLIPAMNHIVLFFVSLWIAIRCSYSRKRVLRCSSGSMTATLTTAFMLPCYEIIWYTISLLNLTGVALYLSSYVPISTASDPALQRSRLLLDNDAPYPCDVANTPFVWMLQLLPFLMAQHSVSHEAVRRAIAYSGVVCVLLIVLKITLCRESSAAIDAITISVHVLLLAFYSWAKFGSHARSSFDFFFVIAVIDLTAAITVDAISILGVGVLSPSFVLIGRCVVLSLDAILTVSILLSLRADTRYWLGIDDTNAASRHPFKQYMRHLSERGMITNFSTRTSVYDVHRMIEEHRKSVVDFSALKLECVIAQGATSIVMRGVLRPNKPIALKIYTSVQVTDEEVQRFSRETALNVQLSHPNIVKFYGLCVVPPTISLVFEFCEYGGLDGVLGNGSMQSLSTKLRAWLDACRALAYLHSFSPPLLHRDIKTDNFLVGQDFTLKLADFGEANLLKPRSDGTMTIAGTVDYMAPEMILGGKTARYGTGVDVYSLMITLWQIMVPDRSPWEGKSHLEVYTCVANGERPPLLPSIPSGCAEILEAGWVANPSQRVAVEDIIPKVHQLWLLSTHQKTLKRTK